MRKKSNYKKRSGKRTTTLRKVKQTAIDRGGIRL